MLITSVVVAVKFCDDQYYSNKHYARIGGIKCGELNEMENELLDLLLYDLHVFPETFEEYLAKLSTQESEGMEVGEGAELAFAADEEIASSSS